MHVVLRRISCHGRNYSQPYVFKRNQSSDNRSHGFGAKFPLKNLSASDFSYERKSAFILGKLPFTMSRVFYRTVLSLILIYNSETTRSILTKFLGDKRSDMENMLAKFCFPKMVAMETVSDHLFFFNA